MKTILNFLKMTLIGGFLFLLPLFLAISLLQKPIGWLAKILNPVAHLLTDRVAGIRTEYLFASLILILVGFLAGLIARAGIGKSLRDKLENLVLGKIPGYNLVKGLAEPGAMGLKPVLVAVGPDKWQLGFLVEVHPDGWRTVFTPSAPAATSGAVQMVRADQVREVTAPGTDVVKCIMRIGEGFRNIAGDEVRKP